MIKMIVTTSNDKSFSLRLAPSNRRFMTVKSKHDRDALEEWAIFAADHISECLEAVAGRGYFTKHEYDWTNLPIALAISYLPPIARLRDKIVYQREVCIG